MKDPALWQRCSALLDEVLDLPEHARAEWLAALHRRDAEAGAAVAKLLCHQPATSSPQAAPAAGLTAFGDALNTALRAETGSPDAAEPGQRFGPWEVQCKLGEGGMGEVWLAARSDALYEGRAAIKLLRDRGDHARFAARFARERQALARLDHPGIARLLDAGVADGQPYLVLEHVEGLLLPEHARRHALDLAARLRLSVQIAEAVGAAHGRLIVHRDLKPGNVMVTAEGRVKLLDFGIAGLLDDDGADAEALTRLHGGGLTLDYAAPEQITGVATGVACDVYSLGVLLFELLSGTRPFAASAAQGRKALEHAVVHDEAPRLSRVLAVPLPADAPAGTRPSDAVRARGDVEAIVAKCLRKDPDARYASMAALAADLEHWLARRPVSAGRDDWRYRGALWLRRHWLPAGLAAATFVALAGGLGASLVLSERARAAQHRAEQAAGESDAVRRFLFEDLLAGARPENQSISDLRMADVLARAGDRVDERFADQPRLAAVAYGAIADAYLALQRLQEAVPLLDRAIALADRFPDRIAAQERLYFLGRKATALWQSSRLPEALATARTVAAGWRATEGPDAAADVLRADVQTGSILLDLGRYAEADAVMATVAAQAPRLSPPDPELGNYARFQQSQSALAQGHHAAAVALLQACFETAQALGGAGSFGAAQMQANLGQAQLRAGDVRLAGITLAAAHASLSRQLGEEHPLLDLVVLWEGEQKLAAGLPREALRELRQAKARTLAHYGPADTTLVLLAPPLAAALLATGEPAAASDELLPALALSRRLLGPLHFRTVAVQLKLAEAQRAAGQSAAAHDTLAAAEAGVAALAAGHPLRTTWEILRTTP